MIIKVYPKNKEKFIKLKKFAKQILKILKKLKITPIAYGSLAYFAYTKDKNIKVNDFDFLLPEKTFKKIMNALDEKKMKYNHVKKDHIIQVFEEKLRIELDSIGGWSKDFPKTFKKINFNGLVVSAVSLKTLKKIYKEGARFSKKRSKAYKKKYNLLNRLCG